MIIEAEPLPETAALLISAAHRLKDERKYLAAYTATQRAAAIAPDHVVVLSTLGAVLWNMGEFERARDALEKCAARIPGNANYWSILGLIYASLRQDEKAEAAYELALSLLPSSEPAIEIGNGDISLAAEQSDTGRMSLLWNRANFRLAKGDWERGFEDYESRIKHRGPPVFPALPYPRWRGEDLSGKTIVIHGEQGVGDTILSSRYIPLIKQRWPSCRIIWFVQPRLQDLFWEFRTVSEMWPAGHPWPKAAFGIMQMSLLEVMGATPDKVAPDPGLLRSRAALTAGSFHLPEPRVAGLKIGIAWTGSPDMLANDDRSIPLELMLELAEDPTLTLYSLQVGLGADQLQFVNCGDLIHDSSQVLSNFGFSATAAMMMNLDLVITVCTSSAHLAGALGVPCWTLLCRDPYWVWGRDGDSTPWYPGVKLFRQNTAGDWRSVVESVKSALAELTQNKIEQEAA